MNQDNENEQAEPREGVRSAVVKIAPDKDEAVLKIYEESLIIRDVALARTITNLDDLKKATDDISILTKLKKAIEEKRKEYVGPIRSNLDQVNASFKEFTAPLEEADKVTREKIKWFNLEQEEVRLAQERANQLAADATRKEAATHGGEITQSIEVVEVQRELKKSMTNLGTTSMKDNWTYEVTDFRELPDEYKLVNTSALNAFAKSTKGTREIPGVKIFNDPTVVVRPK